MRISVRYRYFYSWHTGNRTPPDWDSDSGEAYLIGLCASSAYHMALDTPVRRSRDPRSSQSPISLGQKLATRHIMTVGLRPFHGANNIAGARVSTWIYRIFGSQNVEYTAVFGVLLPGLHFLCGHLLLPEILHLGVLRGQGFQESQTPTWYASFKTSQIWLIFGGYRTVYI